MILASPNNLNSAIVKAKDLLEATSQKQASASLSLQESLKHQSELFEKLVSASDKLSTLSSNLSQSDSLLPANIVILFAVDVTKVKCI
jgi:hypothetical protein